jgi:hypothetical protein
MQVLPATFARRISRVAFSASSECCSGFAVISAPSAVKMSQKSLFLNHYILSNLR